MTHANVPPSSDLAAKLRAARGGAKGEDIARALALVAKQLAVDLSEKWKVKVAGAHATEAQSIAGEPAGPTALVEWRGTTEKAPALRVAASHATADALVEIMCGGACGQVGSGARRAPGFVDRQALAALADDIGRSIGSFASPPRSADYVALAPEDAESAENARPPGMKGGWIELRADGATLRIHVAANPDVLGGEESAAPSAVNGHMWAQRMQAQLARVETRISAVIEDRSISLAEIAACEVGSMLALTASPQSLIKLMAGETTLFECQLGQAGGCYTVRIAGETTDN